MISLAVQLEVMESFTHGTEADSELNYHTRKNTRRRSCSKFWIQSFLAGVPYIVVGFRDDAGRLVRTERLRTKDITHRVKMKSYWQGGCA
ncbi:hypothetical protein HAX54_005583 [Datura stramonium]|uniref:Decapping nuclease n=1 Tax=Datura stramonium TaxID=4076 RepID=A0ABS8WXM2_DATST|nr:hypothetical protein [Datura stramonium]